MDSLKRVPLKQLRLSPLNVRQTNVSEDIPSLAEDIRSKGLIENLVGHTGAARNTIEIAAGGRRLQALQLLAKEGAIARDFPVPVLIVASADARAISLSENVHRIALNPADEYEGFAKVIDEHRDDPDPIGLCARRQGVSRHRVEQSMRLAHLAPEIFEALRLGNLSIDAAKAYSSFENHTLQLAVFQAEEGRQWGTKHNPREIRDALKRRTYPAGIAQAVYVGLDAYHAAGGRSERELFMGVEEGDRLIDPSLLDNLARDKALAELPSLVKRDGFAGGTLTQGFSALPAMPRAPADYAPGALSTAPNGIAPELRAAAIGVYTLAADGAGLTLFGWFRPIAEPAAPLSPPARSPLSTNEYLAETMPAHPAAQAPAARPGDRLRADALKLAAAHIAFEHVAGHALEGRAQWPEGQGYIPAITTAIGDDDTYLIAVQIRVSRDELEAAMPEAEQQLDAEAEANDRVAAAVGQDDGADELAEAGGGGGA